MYACRPASPIAAEITDDAWMTSVAMPRFLADRRSETCVVAIIGSPAMMSETAPPFAASSSSFSPSTCSRERSVMGLPHNASRRESVPSGTMLV